MAFSPVYCNTQLFIYLNIYLFYLFRLELALRRTSAIVPRPGRRRPLRAPPLPRRQRQHRRRVPATPASVQRRRPSRGLQLRLRAIGWPRSLRRRSLRPVHKWYACAVVRVCALFGHVVLKPLWSRSDPPGLPVAVRRLSGARSPPFEGFFGGPPNPFPSCHGVFTPRRRPLRIRDPTAPRCHSSSSSNPSTTRMFRYVRARGVCRVGSHALYASSSTHASRTHPMRIHTCTYVYMYIFIHFTRTHPSSYWPRIWA